MKYTRILIIAIIVALLVGGYIGYLFKGQKVEKEEWEGGSIIQSQEYSVTTTESGTGAVADKFIKDGRGALGSIVVTNAGDTEYLLIDASTTVWNYDNFPTSTKVLADIPGSLVAGTYTFDVLFNHGLYLDVISGDTGTTSVTYR